MAMGEHTICGDADDVDAIFADLDDLISSLPDDLGSSQRADARPAMARAQKGANPKVTSLGALVDEMCEILSRRGPACAPAPTLRRAAARIPRRAPRILCAARARRSPASARRATADSGGADPDPEPPRPRLSVDRGFRAHAPIDVRGALEAAGIRYRRSGRWIRIRAEWRDSQDYNIAVSETGGWHDHATGEHGPWGELAARLGIHVPAGRAHCPPHGGWRAPARTPARRQDDSSDRIRRAQAFYRHTDVLTNSSYLQSRGPGILDAATRAGARSRRALLDGEDRSCIVWPIYDLKSGGHGELIGVQREWERGHANKKMLGRHILNGTAGGFIIPAVTDTGPLYVVEGPVTGCAVAAVTGSAVLVLFDTAGLQRVPTALATRHSRIVIAADNDKSEAGEKAALACARRILLRHPGTRIQITMPAVVGIDWADILERDGAEAVRTALAAGLRDPEPPTPPKGGVVMPLVPWEKTESIPTDPGMPLPEAEGALTRVVRRALQLDAPTVLAATMGLGKTRALAHEAAGSRQPLLILTRTLGDARDLTKQIPLAIFQKGRDADNCYKFPEVDALQTRRRTPYAHLCQTCEHGRADADRVCEYMTRLRESVYHQVVIAVHGAGAEDSLLYRYAAAPEHPNQTVERKLVVDECPATNTTTVVELADIAQWRAAAASAADAVAGGADDRAHQRARAWVSDITIQLDALAAALAAAPAVGMHPLNLPEFTALAGRIPPAALSVDGTLFERVRRDAGRFVIPLKAITTLGQAMAAGTCWTEGGGIMAITPGALWTRLARHGGVLLDATPPLRVQEEVSAAHGTTTTLRAAQPNLQSHQFGPQLHGRGGLMSKDKINKEVRRVRDFLREPGTVVITHKPIADAISDPRVGYWGRDERAHNRWREATRLVLYGLPLLSPRDQIMHYAADRAALAEVGVHWEAWDGSTSRGQTVAIDGWRLRVEAPLPTVPDARAWLLDRLAADVAQAIGRLRAVRRDEQVTVEIYGMLPLVGHGISIDEFRHEREGRAADNLKTRATVAAGVLYMGEHLTRRALSDFVLRHGGRRTSNTTLDCMLEELRAAALARGITLAAACASLIATAERLLGAHGGDALAALHEVAGQAPATELLLWACAHEPLADAPAAAQGP